MKLRFWLLYSFRLLRGRCVECGEAYPAVGVYCPPCFAELLPLWKALPLPVVARQMTPPAMPEAMKDVLERKDVDDDRR